MKRTMKALLVLLVCGLSFAACKKDKDDAPSIVGKWAVFQSQDKYYVNGQLASSDPVVAISPNDFEDYFTMEFKSDGSYENVSYDNSHTGTYRIDGNKFITKRTGSSEEDEATFSISNHELTVTVIYEEVNQGTTEKYETIYKFRKA